MLDFAQIKGDKFRKNIEKFDIKETIEKVMCIQRQKANDKGLDFGVEFINVGDQNGEKESPIIYCDEHRIM